MTHPFERADHGPYDDDRERYYCSCCDVTFAEPYPKYHDVTPCLGCRCMALNTRFAIPPTQFEIDELIESLTPDE
jgi:hypothetical protein